MRRDFYRATPFVHLAAIIVGSSMTLARADGPLLLDSAHANRPMTAQEQRQISHALKGHTFGIAPEQDVRRRVAISEKLSVAVGEHRLGGLGNLYYPVKKDGYHLGEANVSVPWAVKKSNEPGANGGAEAAITGRLEERVAAIVERGVRVTYGKGSDEEAATYPAFLARGGVYPHAWEGKVLTLDADGKQKSYCYACNGNVSGVSYAIEGDNVRIDVAYKAGTPEDQKSAEFPLVVRRRNVARAEEQPETPQGAPVQPRRY